jgi:hypothetical protein
LSPGVHFTNMFTLGFYEQDPKSKKIQSSYQCLFAHLGSLRLKASRKTLVKFTPGHFMCQVPRRSH